MLSAILRRSARLRAAVRSRTRLSSSRNVTSSTQCSAFSTAQCERMALPRVAGSSGQLDREVADLAFDLGGRAVDAANAFDRKHDAQAGPAAQGVEARRLRAGEHAAPDQAAMRVVKRVAIGPAGCANAEAVLVEMLHHGRVGQRMVTLEGQQVVAPRARIFSAIAVWHPSLAFHRLCRWNLLGQLRPWHPG